MGVNPVLQAKSYQAAGAGMISVLTDPVFSKARLKICEK